MSYFLRRLVFLTDNTARVASEIKLVAQWRSQYTSSCVSFNFPLQKLSRENGYKLWVQWLPGSFGWKSVSYDWSMLFKETISQSQAKACEPNRSQESLRRTLVPIPLVVFGERNGALTHIWRIPSTFWNFFQKPEILLCRTRNQLAGCRNL